MRGLYKKFLFDVVVALWSLGLSIAMLPVFGIAELFIDALLAVALAVYIALFLFDKLKRTRGMVFALTTVETVVLGCTAITLIIQQFTSGRIASVCQVIGLVLWLRGAVTIAKLYIGALSVKKPRRELPILGASILMISGGVWLFASPIFSDVVCEWIICAALLINAVVFFGLAFLFYIPQKKKTDKQ